MFYELISFFYHVAVFQLISSQPTFLCHMEPVPFTTVHQYEYDLKIKFEPFYMEFHLDQVSINSKLVVLNVHSNISFLYH